MRGDEGSPTNSHSLEGATLTDEPVTGDRRDVEVVSAGLRSEATHLLSKSDLTLKWALERLPESESRCTQYAAT